MDTALKTNTYGALYRLKYLLSVLHDGQVLTETEQEELVALRTRLIPKIQELLRKKHSETVDEETAIQLLQDTVIETDCPWLRYPNYKEWGVDTNNIASLDYALREAFPGARVYSFADLKRIYEQILILIVQKTITSLSIEDRTITADDILRCRVAALLSC